MTGAPGMQLCTPLVAATRKPVQPHFWTAGRAW